MLAHCPAPNKISYFSFIGEYFLPAGWVCRKVPLESSPGQKEPPPASGQTHHHHSTGSNPSAYSTFPYTFWDALEELKMKIILKKISIPSWKERSKVNEGSHLTKSRKEVTGSSTGPILLFMLYQSVFYLHFSRKYTILQKRRKFSNIL